MKQMNKFIIEEWAPKIEEEDKDKKNKFKKGRRKIEESQSDKEETDEEEVKQNLEEKRRLE